MLLGVERPFVGAFAPGGPGATLPHRNGKVRTVLPASVWNMANGLSRFPRNLGSPGDNAPHDTDCIGGDDRAMVCAEALLKLAHWCQQRQQSASGGVLCPTPRKTESPPRIPQQGACVELAQLWAVLSPTTRQDALQTLSRVIAQQLPTPKTGQEVMHERD
jgi:hypothetical protein